MKKKNSFSSKGTQLIIEDDILKTEQYCKNCTHAGHEKKWIGVSKLWHVQSIGRKADL